MGVLDQITKMKKQGIAEEEIVNNLTQQGISPREINDALKQSQIKNAVSSTGDMGDEMQSSMMPDAETPVPEDQGQEYQPQEEQQYQPSTYEEQQAPVQREYQPQEQQQYYTQGGENYSPSANGVDTDTIIEIADQLFSEKIKKFQKQIDTSTEGDALLQTKLENVSERLKKIEMIIDKLQIAILEKVGSYGQNLESVKKEMSMMQDSFSKMVSPQRETRRLSQEEMNPSQREIKKQIPQEEYQQQPPQEKEFSPEEFKTSPKKFSRK